MGSSMGWMQERRANQAAASDCLRAIFDQVDTNKTGCLDACEINALLEDTGVNVRPRTLRAIMQELDVNHDGRVTFEELQSALSKHGNLQMAKTPQGLAMLLLLDTLPCTVATGSDILPEMPGDVPHTSPHRMLRPWQILCGTMVGTVAARTAVAPLELVRVQRMIDIAAPRTSTWKLLSTAWASTGLRGMYKGHLVNLARILPSVTINTSIFVNGLGLLSDKSDPLERGVLAVCASVLALLPMHPLDVIRTRLAAQESNGSNMYYINAKHAARRIVDEERVRGLWKGLGPTIGSTVPFAWGYMTAYSWLQNQTEYLDSPELHPWRLCVCAMAGGIVGQALAQPLETVARLRAIEHEPFVSELGLSDKSVFRSSRAAFSHIVGHWGVLRLWHGFSLSCYKAVMLCAISVATRENVYLWIDGPRSPAFPAPEPEEGFYG